MLPLCSGAQRTPPSLQRTAPSMLLLPSAGSLLGPFTTPLQPSSLSWFPPRSLHNLSPAFFPQLVPSLVPSQPLSSLLSPGAPPPPAVC